MIYKKEVLKSCFVKLLFICLSASIVFAYSGGTGDVNSPYQIATISDFQQLMHTSLDWNKNFIMTADVNLMYVPLVPIGDYLQQFIGVFDGNNHIIRKARMSQAHDKVGLFGSIGSSGKIRNLGIEDINIAGRNYTGGLVGYAGSGSSITNCHATGAIHNTSTNSFQYLGILVGYADNGSIITNCYSAGTVSGYQYVGGLVGYIYNGSITNCHSTSAVSSTSGSSQNIGGLVGYIYSGSITNCYSTGTVSSNSQNVGGLIGYYNSNNSITNCYSTGAVSGSDGVGGLIGYYNSNNSITNCYSTATVSGNSNYIGGLVGDYCGGSITTSYSTGTVNGSSSSQYVGGLVGYNGYSRISSITTSYSTGAVSGYQYVGGLAGYNNSNSSIIDCCSASAVSGSFNLGGLVGRNDGTISGHCSSAGKVSGHQYVGGLVGYYINNSNSNFTLANCYSTGDVNGVSGSSYVGGLMGYYSGGYYGANLTNCYSTGNVTGDAGQYIGGLVGYYYNYNGGSGSYTGSILNCYSTGDVTGTSASSDIGGLVGYLEYGSLTNCYSTGNVIGSSNSQYVGGLVGENYSGSITTCCSTGEVDGSWTSYVGGLAGYNSSTISNCYSTGAVSGYKSQYVGGIVGENSGNITHCSSTGAVSGTLNSKYVGGLVGHNSTPPYNAVGIANCYSTGAVSGTQYIGGLVGYNDSYGKITDCYSAGMVSGSSNLGGLVGYDDGNGSVIASFWDVNSSGQSASAGGTGKTTTEMKSFSTFTSAGWNFITVWDINDGLTYPFFFKKTHYSGGIGTPAAPYQIANLNELCMLAVTVEDYNKCFILTADIDLAARGSCPTAIIAPDTDPMSEGYQGTAFKGTFDGNGHKITHLTINGGSNNYIGLFGDLSSGGQILNLGVEDVNIQANSRVGGLVGFIGTSGGTIRNCYTTGVVTGDTYFGEAAYAGGTYAGGLVGRSYGNIIECYSKCTVNGNINFIGGLVGYQGSWDYESVITSCYAAGAVDGNDYVGGLVGQCDYGIIETSYSVGSVNGNFDVGGLVGYSYDQNTVNTSFWDVNSSGQSTSAGGTPKTTPEMKAESTFTSAGWDFTDETVNGPNDVWRMCVDGLNYPKLSWQFLPGDFGCPDGVDISDLIILINQWLQAPGTPSADIAPPGGDGIVNFLDFAVFAENWLRQD